MKKKETFSAITRFNQMNVSCGDSPKGYGKAYFALRSFKPGEVVIKGFGVPGNHQTSNFSVQIGLERHFIPRKWTGKYMNHVCVKPACKVVTRSTGFPDWVADRHIAKGEEITYNYAMSEFEWSDVAVEKVIWCLCKTKKRNHKIPSFSLLKHNTKLKLKNKLSIYLQNLCDAL